MSPRSSPSFAQGRIAALTLALTFALSLFVTGTLWRHPGRGIPWVYYRGDLSAERYSRPGDHLQLLGRFVLADQMLRGDIPLFCNVYEFNRGDDAARYRPGPYYAPFSLVFAALSRIGSWAFAWNALGLISLWLTLYFTYILLRRFTDRPAAAMTAAALTVLHPYRLENLLGGAPSGFSLLWVPLLFWGVDAAARDGDRRGGLAAGAALWGAAWTDSQTFFFMALAGPIWFLLRIAVFPPAGIPWPARWGRALRGALPGAPLLAPAALAVFWMRGKIEGSFHMAGGREIRELLLYSPPPSALFSLNPGQPVQVYLGYAWLALMAAGLFALIWMGLRRRADSARWVLLWIVIVGALICIIGLALGLYGPFGGLPIRAARKLIPVFRSVRAPPKMYCLMPTTMAVSAVLAWRTLAAAGFRRVGLAALLWGGAMFAEYAARAKPGVCLLDETQGAYAAVREDAGPEAAPRALVLPLWPGDSHWTSVYIYHAMQYGIRLLNGYSPVVDRDYVEQVFQPLRGLNAGAISDENLDALSRMGIRYLLLHEDLFPERVSPAPVAHTLDRLLRHPRLDFLARDRAVWAFRIRETPAERPAPPARWALPPAPPAFRFHAGHLQTEDERPVHRAADTPDATHDVFVRMEAGGDAFRLPRFSAFSPPERALWLRVRGNGILRSDATAEGAPGWSWRAEAPVAAPRWEWIFLPLEAPPNYVTLRARLRAVSGTVDVDAGLLVTGEWSPSLPPEGIEFLAASLFRAGFTDPESGAVRLEPKRVDEDRIFYGPRLPLAPGEYVAELRYASDAAAGTRLGDWRQDFPPAANPEVLPVLASAQKVELRFRQTDHRWVEFGFRYTGAAAMELRAVRIRPLDAER